MNSITPIHDYPQRSIRSRTLVSDICEQSRFKRRGILAALVLAFLSLLPAVLPAADYVYWTESTRNPGIVSTRIMRAMTDGSAVEPVLSLGASENVLGGIAVDVANNHLYSGSRLALFRVNLDGACRVNLVPAINEVGDVEVDLAGGKIYWTEGGGGQNAIRRANLDGSNPQTLRNIGFAGLMEGIALDLQAGKLYFSQNVGVGNDAIWSMNLDGGGASIFKMLDGPQANPHDVEIDARRRRLYWNQTPSQGIFQADLDGSGVYRLLIVPPDGTQNGFHFDAVADKFCVSGANADRIQSQNLDGTGFITIVPGRTYVNYIEVAHTLEADYVYWTESTRNPGIVATRIMRALTDGTAVEPVLSLGSSESVLGGIAVDVANGLLYSGTRLALFRVTLDGTCRVNLVPAINQVGDVELDLAGGKIYWTEGGSGQNAIRRANLDGSNPQTLRNIGSAGGMEGIALDLQVGRLYFSENVNVGNDMIRCMNLDGSGVTIFKSLSGALANPHDVEIDPARRKLYWNQAPSQGIFQANLDGSGYYTLLVAPPDGAQNGFHFDAATNKFFVCNANAASVQSLNMDGSDFTTLVPERTFVNYLEVAHTLPSDDYVYWTESTRNPSIVSTRIMRALIDGRAVEPVFSLDAGEGVLGGIAVDAANGHLYCGSRVVLFRVNLDGSSRVNLVPALNQVGDVELDLAGGKIYWTEGGSGQNAIRRANLDGSNPQILRNIGSAGGMEGIALDLQAGKLYFQQNVGVGNDAIWSMNLDGSGAGIFKTLSGPLANPHDVEIDPARGKLYWNQTPSQGIFQANVDGSGACSLLVLLPDGTNNGFHFDAVTNKFIVSGANADRVQGLNMDGSNFRTLVPLRTYVNYIEVAHNVSNFPREGVIDSSSITSAGGPGGNQVTMNLTGHGVPGLRYVVEGSSDLTTWTTLDTATATAAPGTGAFQFSVSEAPGVRRRFYRVRPAS